MAIKGNLNRTHNGFGHVLVPVLLTIAAASVLFLLVRFMGDAGERKSEPELPIESKTAELHSKFLYSASYNIQADYYTGYLPANSATGGSIVRLKDGYLLTNGDGQLFSVDWQTDTEQLNVEALPYRAPLNGDELDQAEIPGLKRDWFRTLDTLALEQDRQVRIFVSHHIWKPEDRCFAVQISVLSGATDEILSGRANPAWDTLFETTPCLPLKDYGPVFMGQESGGRLGILPSGELLLTLGDQAFDGMLTEEMLAQEPDNSYGKTLIVDSVTGTSRIFTLGHRNPQGLFVAPDGKIWSTEHGPKGGDELNLLVEGANYGWPYVTYGTQYRTIVWPLSEEQGRHDGYRKPVFAWVPSIGISNLIGMQGELFRWWQGDLIVATLRDEMLLRLRIDGDHVVLAEPILVGGRIRDLLEGHDGRLILWMDNQTLISLKPADQSNDGKLAFTVSCRGCHRDREEKGKPHGIGPRMVGIYDSPMAAATDYKYSPAMMELEGKWSREELDKFLRNPTAYLPGTAMQVEGIKDDERRTAIIDYLESIR